VSELTYRVAHRKGPKTLYEEIGHLERLGTSNGGITLPFRVIRRLGFKIPPSHQPPFALCAQQISHHVARWLLCNLSNSLGALPLL
jgi:hypothetical protein